MHVRQVLKVKWLPCIVVLLGCMGATATGTVPRRANVHPGIDVLLSDSIYLVRGRRVGLVTNVAAVDADGVGDIARLRTAHINLVALFAPEHGLSEAAAPGATVATSHDSATNTPIYSLYGATISPTDSMLRGVDVMLVDLPDVGARYYTYLATTIEVMKAAARHDVPVVILDRPDPIGGLMQGNILDTAFASMVGRLAVPMRHGLTLGEEARLARADLGLATSLHVVPVSGWRRSMSFDDTGLPFRAPSPNLQSVAALYDYPGTCLFEGTALSVGRGTDHAFEQVGAPWLDASSVTTAMNALQLPGVTFMTVSFTPRAPGDKKFADTLVAGIRWQVTDRARFDPTATAVQLLALLQARYPAQLKIGASFDRLAGGPTLRAALQRGDAAASIVGSWAGPLETYRRRVEKFLLYR